MSEVVRRMKANKKLEGTPCAWCNNAIQLGDDVAVCEACGTAHHAACWDKNGGCGEKSCINAPFKTVTDAVVERETKAPALRSDQMICPHCKATIPSGSVKCPNCRRFTSPDGIYHGPTSQAKEARNALIVAIIGLFILGFVLGPLAIRNARRAKDTIRADYTLRGEGVATAAEIIGWIGLVGSILVIVLRLTGG